MPGLLSLNSFEARLYKQPAEPEILGCVWTVCLQARCDCSPIKVALGISEQLLLAAASCGFDCFIYGVPLQYAQAVDDVVWSESE